MKLKSCRIKIVDIFLFIKSLPQSITIIPIFTHLRGVKTLDFVYKIELVRTVSAEHGNNRLLFWFMFYRVMSLVYL